MFTISDTFPVSFNNFTGVIPKEIWYLKELEVLILGRNNFEVLINAYYKTKKVEAAMNLFREIRHKGLTPNVVVCNTVMQGLFSAESYLSAREVFDEMQAAGIKPNFHTYCIMLDGLCKIGKVHEAMQLFHSMEADGVDLHISMYNIILDGLFQQSLP
ncbi:pentatricopeptide repeat-containing protein At3g22470, mitochondrial-like [Coffea eugenioides]|uniref:pentatricopeptide repeat-containing protein At3g22470, mitochondrial-like n=1 Tax=Coffea eugenioides TaxID=49369 RepID=UPI000F60C738|nr:pentatricopeptide repeat-containing protein At3g22470, mitochondrial-like [Coffea eugenioides]